ncbi:MAG TPA: helix-turn-helix domain-containing protein [Candidatus Micrarchaeia archaeon]|nr:helix-turn-helix domain-containing protein [Candidatus Micrarchaeia archaeon]
MGSAEVGHRLGIHPLSASRLIRTGRLPGRLIGRTWVVRAADVERLARTYTGRPGRPRKRP